MHNAHGLNKRKFWTIYWRPIIPKAGAKQSSFLALGSALTNGNTWLTHCGFMEQAMKLLRLNRRHLG